MIAKNMMIASRRNVKRRLCVVFTVCWYMAVGSVTLYSDEPAAATGNISAIWANDGGDKITRGELRSSSGANVFNSLWDGSRIALNGAKNEVISFNLVLEAATSPATRVSVSFSRFVGPNGAVIESAPATGNRVFDWTRRPIELFYVRYLQIKGLSYFGYANYDERHIPEKLRRPWTGAGHATGLWTDRPNHDAYYPDIAVPLELVPRFDIQGGSNQSIWCDVYIPKSAQAGLYTGTVTVSEGSSVTSVPVELTVHTFTLPDVPSAKTMVFFDSASLNTRFVGHKYLPGGDPGVASALSAHDRLFLMAHRHKLTMIGESSWIDDDSAGLDRPSKSTPRRLAGSFYTAANGYDGPGVGQPNDTYAIEMYGTWVGSWPPADEAAMWKHTDAWESWFQANAPATERFLYLIDESADFAQTEKWAAWMLANPGSGRKLSSMATVSFLAAANQIPSLHAPTHPAGLSPRAATEAALATLKTAGKLVYTYGGERPCSGSDSIEDEGAAFRMRPWAQFKLGLDRWFQWQSTSWSYTGDINVFQVANTFGTVTGVDPVVGEFGGSNGDGSLFYPGTDKIFPSDSYGLNGPIASLRLKHWRRGVQDADYLKLASAIDPAAVAAIVQRMVPSVLWEVDVADPKDPTWQLADISWPTDPDAWEQARAELTAIIER
jgi:hypothetical protein